MTLIQFLIIYFLLVMLASLIICGFYIVTRGEWYVLPDGTFKKSGMIFKEWSLFWEQYRKERKIYYAPGEAAQKWIFLTKVREALAKEIVWPGKDGYWRKMMDRNFTEDEITSLSDLLSCQFEKSPGMKCLRAYITEPVYVFPSWIRRPVSECPICMSSVYGSAFYWFVITLSKSQNIFIWSSNSFWAKIGFWVFFCLILACVNKYIAQKMKL